MTRSEYTANEALATPPASWTIPAPRRTPRRPGIITRIIRRIIGA
jgi:hypothetical protein